MPVSIFLRLLPFCKPDDTVYVKRPSELDKKHNPKEDEKMVKSIQSTNKPYIQPAATYNTENLSTLMRRSSKRNSNANANNVGANLTSNLNSNGSKKPYGYQYNDGYNKW